MHPDIYNRWQHQLQQLHQVTLATLVHGVQKDTDQCAEGPLPKCLRNFIIFIIIAINITVTSTITISIDIIIILREAFKNYLADFFR